MFKLVMVLRFTSLIAFELPGRYCPLLCLLLLFVDYLGVWAGTCSLMFAVGLV